MPEVGSEHYSWRAKYKVRGEQFGAYLSLLAWLGLRVLYRAVPGYGPDIALFSSNLVIPTEASPASCKRRELESGDRLKS